MAEKKFTNELKQAFDYIQNTILKEYETDKISTEYFILSILSNDFTVGYKVLSKIMLNETLEKSRLHFVQWLSMNTKKLGETFQYDELFEKSINDASILAFKQKSNIINSGHVLYSILINNGEINRYFKTLGVTVNQIVSQVAEETNNILEEEKQKKEKDFVSVVPQKHTKPQKKENKNVVEKISDIDETIKINSKVDGECG